MSPAWISGLRESTSGLPDSENIPKYIPPDEYWGCTSYSCYVNNVIRRLSGEYSEENIIQQNITYKKIIQDKMMAAIKELENKKHQKTNSEPNEFERVKQVIKYKATKHSEFYRNLLNRSDGANAVSSVGKREMAPAVALSQTSSANAHSDSISTLSDRQTTNVDISDSNGSQTRSRKNGVFQMHDEKRDDIKFPSVRGFVNKYTELINQMDQSKKKKVHKTEETSTNDEGYLVPPPSGYCSSSNNSDDERNWTYKKNSDVKRCCSSDSALGLLQSDEERSASPNVWAEIKKDAESPSVPNPYLRRASIDHFNVPTKTLIEANIVPFPLNRKLSECDSIDDLEGKVDSRRQSCFTDDGDEPPRYRYWRTPSVVVSDYSDDVIGGLTLEDIEYFRNQRKSVTSSPDSSLNSSCSNLNYCGSSVSVLEGDFTLRTPSRKSSDCSTLSNFSNPDEDDDEHHLQLTNVVYGNKVSVFFSF